MPIQRHVVSSLVCAFALSACDGDSHSPPAAPPPSTTPSVTIMPVLAGLNAAAPLFLTQPPGDTQRAFVVSQEGAIHVVNLDGSNPRIFLNINPRVTDEGGEQGLLGLAFDPNYASNGFFYVNYNPNAVAASRSTNISRFKVSSDPAAADPASETVLLSYTQPFPNHKGGWLGFGPDGKLYITSGDGGSGGDPQNNAQSLNTPLGKILRINADGSIPADNPFAASLSARGEIWALGLRNPFRASFDRTTGELWAGDVGQNAWEEIDLITRGGNYGWRKFEGNHVFNATDPTPANAIAPVYEYAQDAGRCSVIGGYVYRGSAIASLRGRYVYGDFCTGEIWTLSGSTSTPLATAPTQITSFGEDALGELYITGANGSIYKLVSGM